jgi:hypothetical protein
MKVRWRPAVLASLGTAAVLAAIGLSTTAASAAAPTLLYASPTGTGTTCSFTAPCSLTGARDRVAGLVPSMSADIVVNLRGGTYRLTNPLTFRSADSGANGHTVVYASFPGERALLSGARQVTGFSVFDPGRNIYRAAVTPGTTGRQLFVNGVRAQRARGPLNPAGFTLSGSSFVNPSDPSYASFTNASQVEVAYNTQWKHMRCPLASITKPAGGGSSLNVDPACFANNNTNVPNPGFPFNGYGLPKLQGISWVENAYQLLDQPGEFYLDSAAGALYYIQRPGENLATADVELPALETLVNLAGTPGHLAAVNDNDVRAVYSGSSWATSSNRPFGNYLNDVHYATVNGDSVSFTFSGTGVDVLSEINSDEGGIDVYVDGTKTTSVSAAGPTRLAQQPVVSVTGLAKGNHTVKLVKTGGQYMLIDGFTVIPDEIAPVHDITWQDVSFGYTTWTLPSTAGYIDNQAGVLWDATTHLPTRIPAAVQVHRGKNIVFSGVEVAHTGGTGIDLADGTQDSTITASYIHDTSGGGISLGEVDDYYLSDTTRMTSGDTISDNVIDHPGQDYQDAVAIWVGYSRTATIARNDISHTPYSGISLGWGWGWASECSLQGGQPCRHGTIYAGANQILANRVDDVMGVLHDGGPIYTLGGQGGGNATMTSVLAGNVVTTGNHTNYMLYHDEGSSYWDTHDNVVDFATGHWMGMWNTSIHRITVHDNYSSLSKTDINGTDITFKQATIVSGGNWPAAAQTIMAAAGPRPAYRPLTARVDDNDLAIRYSGSWSSNGFRGYGDLNDQIHATQVNGDTATLTFTGAAISVIGEKNADQGNVEIILDGVSKGLVNTAATTRQTQQTIYTTAGLDPTVSHTIQVVKRSGTWATIDGFQLTRTVNDTDPALSYQGSWGHLGSRGYGDYADDVHYTTTNGDAVVVTFYGTGINVLTETNTDEGAIGVALDGVSQPNVNANATSRHAQQSIYSVSGLPLGRHTLRLTKQSGQYLVIDRFDIS